MSTQTPRDRPATYGIRFFDCDGEVRLLQVAGDSRVKMRRVGQSIRDWWGTPPKHAEWSAYPAEPTDGQAYPNQTEAEQVARRLTR